MRKNRVDPPRFLVEIAGNHILTSARRAVFHEGSGLASPLSAVDSLGWSFFFVEVALADFSPFVVVTCRVGLAALALNLWLLANGLHLPSGWRNWRPLFAMGFLNNVLPFTLIAYGQLRIESGLASIFNATTPLFTVVFAHFLTQDERMTPLKLAGVALGIAGVVALIGPRALLTVAPENIAQYGVLLAAVSYALATIYGKRLTALPTSVAATGMLTASTAMMLPIALVFGASDASNFNVLSIGALAALALLSTSAAYIIYFRILASAGSTNLALVTFLIPVSAIALGAIFLGERLEANAFIGMALIFAGLATVDGRLFGRSAGRTAQR